MASSANTSRLKTQLQTSNWEEVYKDQNPCTSYDTFLEILNTQMNECLPWKKFEVKTCKSEWLTKGILISCRQKNHLFKIFKCNPSTESEIIYKNYKNKLPVTHVIRQRKNILKKNLSYIKIIAEKHGAP